MPKQEVIEIIGEPTSRHMVDSPGTYWCYGSDSFEDREEYCGNAAIEMGANVVLSVPPIIP